MAAITAAVVVGAGMAYSANRQGAAAKKGAKAQGDAASATLAKQDELYNQSRDDAMPWLTAGQDALSQMQTLNSGDYSSFNESPDYQFARDQSLQSQERGAAARGGFMGGGADADRMALASGLASQNFNNYYSKLAGLSSGGQQQSQYLGNLGQSYGDQFARAMGQKGQANAQYAMAGPMTQAGYGNALASAASTYMGGAGGGGGGNFSSMFGGGGQSSYGSMPSLWGQQAGSGQGSMYNFGSNVGNVWGGG